MLSLLKIKSSEERKVWLDSFNPETHTWLVSDLRSKFEIQNTLILKNKYYEDHAVLRANELWQTILKRYSPDFRVVGRDFMKTWLREKLSVSEILAAKNRGEDTVLSFLDSMMQIISHPMGQDQIHQWLVEHSGAQARWGVWFDLSYQLGQELLQSKKMSSRWIAPWLSNQTGWEKLWKKNLIVDLGPDLSRVEAQVLHELSRVVDVTVIQPVVADEQKYHYLMRGYEELHGFSTVLQPDFTNESRTQNLRKIYRFASPLAEVKQATLLVRRWIESGVRPENIVVSAANIEDYWPSLQYYFSEEGIPVAKDLTARLQSLPSVMRWLSRMKLAMRNFEYPDLELVFFRDEALEKTQQLRYEKFSALFKNLLDESDLTRDAQVFQAFKEDAIPQEPISIQRFLGIMSRFWQDENLGILENVMRTFLEVAEDSLKLKFSNWIYWIEQICAHDEFILTPSSRLGVQLVNIQSVDSLNFSHRIFLGLTESAFKNKTLKIISASEVEKIFGDTGFQLPHPEQLALDYELRWLLQNKSQEDALFFPMTNMDGSIEAPHREWMTRTTGKEIPLSVPSGARADATKPPVDEIQTQIRQDLGEELQAPILGAQVTRMSASQFETFFDCGFKFAANKLFKLQDPAEVDLDPDLRSRGQLIHSLFEALSLEPRRYDWTHEEIKHLLDEKRSFLLSHKKGSSLVSFGDNSLWPSLRENLAQLGKRFLEFEKNTSSERTKTLACEHSFTVLVDGLEWVGSIDRIDLSKDGELVVYDYKSRNDQYNSTQWLKKNHLQLGFYSWLISKGYLTIAEQNNISQALYYIYKDFKMHGADAKELRAFDAEIEAKLSEFKIKSARGEYQPVPLDVKTCEYCKWSQLCRAPHLNH